MDVTSSPLKAIKKMNNHLVYNLQAQYISTLDWDWDSSVFIFHFGNCLQQSSHLF